MQSGAASSSSNLAAPSLPAAHMTFTSELRTSEVQQVRSSSVGLQKNTSTSTKRTIDGSNNRLIGEMSKRSPSISDCTNLADNGHLMKKGTNAPEFTTGLRRSLSEASHETSDSIQTKRLKITRTITPTVNGDHTGNSRRTNPPMMYLAKNVSLSEAVLGGGSGIVRKSSC